MVSIFASLKARKKGVVEGKGDRGKEYKNNKGNKRYRGYKFYLRFRLNKNWEDINGTKMAIRDIPDSQIHSKSKNNNNNNKKRKKRRIYANIPKTRFYFSFVAISPLVLLAPFQMKKIINLKSLPVRRTRVHFTRL